MESWPTSDEATWTPGEVRDLEAALEREREIVQAQADELAKRRAWTTTKPRVVWTGDL